MILDVTHRTTYRYSQPVSLGYSEARLLPRELPIQVNRSSALHVHPVPAMRTERTDYFGNRVVHLSFDEPHDELVVTAHSVVSTEPLPPGSIDHFGDPWELARLLPSQLHGGGAHDAEFALPSPLVPTSATLRAYAELTFTPGRPLLDAVQHLCHRIHTDFDYRPGVTTISTSVDEVLEAREGVCQDFAHVAIGALRSIGLGAQYVSGYLETEPPPGEPRLAGVDASHAWFSVFAPEGGWLHVDPTNNQLVNERYVVLGWGRDYGDVAPLKGVVFSGGGEQTLTVAVDVVRVNGTDGT